MYECFHAQKELEKRWRRAEEAVAVVADVPCSQRVEEGQSLVDEGGIERGQVDHWKFAC